MQSLFSFFSFRPRPEKPAKKKKTKLNQTPLRRLRTAMSSLLKIAVAALAFTAVPAFAQDETLGELEEIGENEIEGGKKERPPLPLSSSSLARTRAQTAIL